MDTYCKKSNNLTLKKQLQKNFFPSFRIYLFEFSRSSEKKFRSYKVKWIFDIVLSDFLGEFLIVLSRCCGNDYQKGSCLLEEVLRFKTILKSIEVVGS